MTKNPAKKPKTDTMLALRLDANGIAELLGLSVAASTSYGAKAVSSRPATGSTASWMR
jgi:hypothetical protein